MDALIIEGLRTPFGKHGGALRDVRPDDLLASLLAELRDSLGFDNNAIDDVIIGCANQSGEDARNVARHAALLAGFSERTPAMTVNRLCGSGLAAVADGARAIAVGEAELVFTGGVESMTRAPFVMAKAERAYSRDLRMYDSAVGARFPNPRLSALFGDDSNPEVGDNIAREFNVSRADCDAWALRSQQRYEDARRSGFFSHEIVAVETPSPKGCVEVARDEHPRPTTTLEALQSLKPLYAEGVVTAGNASGINDGAAALVLASATAVRRLGLPPRARILRTAVAGIEPRLFGMAPVPAVHKVLAGTGLGLADMDVIEINEAFASQTIANVRELGLLETDDRVNPNGGAIAVGHPLGASGARLVLTALRELERREGRYALITLCIGVGQGIATIIESVS